MSAYYYKSSIYFTLIAWVVAQREKNKSRDERASARVLDGAILWRNRSPAYRFQDRTRVTYLSLKSCVVHKRHFSRRQAPSSRAREKRHSNFSFAPNEQAKWVFLFNMGEQLRSTAGMIWIKFLPGQGNLYRKINLHVNGPRFTVFTVNNYTQMYTLPPAFFHLSCVDLNPETGFFPRVQRFQLVMTEHDGLMDCSAASVFVPTLIKKNEAASTYHRANVAIGTAPNGLNLENIIRQLR